MVTDYSIAPATPLFSIVIAVYNDWGPLDQCLRSLQQQTDKPSFEVVIVDDGSQEAAPEFIHQWLDCYPLTLIEQTHAGISVARNRGIQIARGKVLLFVDADCKLQINCLATLALTISALPQHNAFQLRLVGDRSGLVGRAEDLRLITIQNHMLQPSGCIRYLNTAGFAIRRTRVDSDGDLFDPVARRAEDTLLMTDLMEDGELPLFVADATVQHAIPLSLIRWLGKAVRSAYLEAKTYDIIGSRAARFRASHRDRLIMLRSMWRTSGQASIGRLAWFAAVVRQSLRLIILSLADVFGGWSGLHGPTDSSAARKACQRGDGPLSRDHNH
jgi:glycosyltransferase involved in cell wall biosynthesis